jgi:hypothetical protein
LYLGCGLEAVSRIFGERFQYDLFDRWWDRTADLARARWHVCWVSHLDDVFKGQRPGEHLVEHDAQGKDVRTSIQPLVSPPHFRSLLGREIFWRRHA